MRALAAPLAALLLLAGCLGGSTPADVTPLASDSPPSGASPANAAAGNATRLANGTSTSPLAALAQQWVLDQWKGQDKLTVVDDTRTAANYPAVKDVFGCIVNCFDAFFLPKKGAFVPPGAASVEVTATWTTPPTTPGLTMLFAYRTAADSPGVQSTIENSKPFSITVAPKDADAPLAPASQWWFDLFPQPDPAGAATDFDVHLVVVVHRGQDAPAFDAPADPWNGGSSITLAKVSSDETTITTPESFSCPSNCRWGWDSKGPGLVPAGAAKVVATATWTWSGPTKVVLFAIPPGADQPVPMSVAKDGDTSRTFEVQPPAGALDSPYQQRSGWFFFGHPDGGAVPAGVAMGTLSLDIQALRGA